MYIYIYIYMLYNVDVCMCVYMYVCVYIYIYIYVCVYIYIYICTHMLYIHIYNTHIKPALSEGARPGASTSGRVGLMTSIDKDASV